MLKIFYNTVSGRSSTFWYAATSPTAEKFVKNISRYRTYYARKANEKYLYWRLTCRRAPVYTYPNWWLIWLINSYNTGVRSRLQYGCPWIFQRYHTCVSVMRAFIAGCMIWPHYANIVVMKTLMEEFDESIRRYKQQDTVWCQSPLALIILEENIIYVLQLIPSYYLLIRWKK